MKNVLKVCYGFAVPAFGGYERNEVYHLGKLNWQDHVFSYLPTFGEVPLESEREAFEEVSALYQWKKLYMGKDEAEAFFSASEFGRARRCQ